MSGLMQRPCRRLSGTQDAAICQSDAPSLWHSSLFLHNFTHFIYTCTHTHPMDNIHKYKRKHLFRSKSKQKRHQVEGWGFKDEALTEKESVDQECISTLPKFPIIDWYDPFQPCSTLASVDNLNISCNQFGIESLMDWRSTAWNKQIYTGWGFIFTIVPTLSRYTLCYCVLHRQF